MPQQVTWSAPLSHTRVMVETAIMRAPGVYRLVQADENDRLSVYYIGKADDLRARLLEHLRREEENQCIRDTIRTKRCFFIVAYVTQEEIRSGAEAFLYQYYSRHAPLCNQAPPSGTPLEINLN